MPAAPLVVGFDLDLTLIDSRPGFAETLRALLAEHPTPDGTEVDVDDVCRRLGPPLDHLLSPYYAAHQLPGLVDRFRTLYPERAVGTSPALSGAREALAAVRRHGGRTVVVTGKFTPNAALHLEHLGLDVDHLAGELWGVGKAGVLSEQGVSVYVGDHVHDVEGALAAGAMSVSVLTGGSTAAELREAGTHVVLAGLEDFPAWLDEHLLQLRLAALEERLRELGSVLVAFSGGADSALLLAAAVRALGPDAVAAATGYSDSLPQVERGPARELADALGVRVLTPRTREMDRPGYRANDGDRCFHCKAELLDVLRPLAAEMGLAHVATGTNADDLVAGFRPGIRAAADRGAVTPLADAGLTKEQVRLASRRWGLPTWDKPAAACLSSRVAYGVEVTPFRLARVERAEVNVREALRSHGVLVRDLRVRDLGDRASVELDRTALARLDDPAARGAVAEAVVAAGFVAADIDRRGFRSGSMNEQLADPERFR